VVEPSEGSSSNFSGNPVLDQFWYPVALTREVTADPRPVTLLGRPYVLWRDALGRPSVLPDRCSHRNSPLSIGTISDAGCLRCPYHGWEFDGDGRCVSIPSSGAGAPVPPKAHLRPAHSVDRYGLVWMCPGEPASGIPEMPWDDDPSFRRFQNPVQEWAVAATRMVDNFMDYSHFPYVHVVSFGGAAATEIPNMELGPLPDGFFGYEYEVIAANDSGGQSVSGQASPVVHRRMTTGFHLPFAVRSTIEYDTGLQHILLLLSTPVDDTHSYFTFVVWRNADHDADESAVMAFDRLIGSEDKTMLERLSGPLPLGNEGVVSVQADKPSVEWKRQLRELLSASPQAPRPAAAATTAR
jgi:phenylpropionate dioxygenase-like ring-hydroxylating dioxygenase large terminal subunit